MTHFDVNAVVTVNLTAGGCFNNLGFGQCFDGFTELFRCHALELELLSTELPHGPASSIKLLKANAKQGLCGGIKGDEVDYEARFAVPVDFGDIGAVLVQNQHREEMFLKSIVLNGLPNGAITIVCDSWIHSKFDHPHKRVFFTNKSYLPSQTPDGLRQIREDELQILRGNGEGERKRTERIYDYAVYNDLGDPDSNAELLRPVLGGTKEFPYPRRCRTGRPMSTNYSSTEKRIGSAYVPRDEQFANAKGVDFTINLIKAVVHALIPSLETAMAGDANLGFPSFPSINALFSEGIPLPRLPNQKQMKKDFPNLKPNDLGKNILLFPPPDFLERDRFGWLRDEEFARQTLAGTNPCSIKLVREWPLKSKLGNVYGPPESAITTEHIQPGIIGTIEKAIEEKKLFILDFYDVLMPYVNKVREMKGTTLYGSRTLFYLTPQGVLKPLAIELTRPPINDKPQWKRVYTPSLDGTGSWLWKLAKAHVLAHDSIHHQLINHWLRAHCCTEPYIIATKRQLSSMHPIYRLLEPHFRYTMEINALARGILVNAGGIIESVFPVHKYAMEISSRVYGKDWRFDLQGLPADLISRGMAVKVEDRSAPHGLKLAIKDYPFANDGLLLWDAVKKWVTDYVNIYYTREELVGSDEELKKWWEEIQSVGHGDKKNEEGWPKLQTKQDLIEIITTMIWVSSGHHAAVNFGQYTFTAYIPNRPSIARTKMPDEDPTEAEWNYFIKRPEIALLESLPTKIQAAKIMAILEVLSTHSPDEEYVGDRIEASWEAEENVKAAFERFQGRLREMVSVIDERNMDVNLKNRVGAGIVPYELLKPFSNAGLTGMGVPNSISI